MGLFSLLTVALLQAPGCPLEAVNQRIDTPDRVCDPSCLATCRVNECTTLPEDVVFQEDDVNYCTLRSDNAPRVANQVWLQIRVAVFSGLTPSAAEFRETLVGNDASILKAATQLLKGSDDALDTPCCVGFELQSGEDAVVIKEAEEDPLAAVWRINPRDDTQKRVMIGAAATEGIAVVVVQDMLREGNRVAAGTSLISLGASLIVNGQDHTTWAHELGHLTGMGHYDCNNDEFEERLMYYKHSGDEDNVIACVECNFFRAHLVGHPTINRAERGQCRIDLDDFPDVILGSSPVDRDTSTSICALTVGRGTGSTPFALYGILLVMLVRRRQWFGLLVLLVCGCDANIPSDVVSLEVGGRCVDSDRDGYGEGCEKGPDCNDSQFSVHDGAFEWCDSLDNDCDGLIDEDSGAGGVCSVGYAGCKLDGYWVCNEARGLDCRPVGGVPPDLCDDIDNDCDGQIDEADPSVGTPCDATGQTGQCAQGAVICSTGNLICGPSDPQPETCDAQDNDCDGQTDENEGGVALQVSCRPDVPSQGECNPGKALCTGNEEALWGPCVDYAGPQEEICDTLDNDCDGQVDELAGGCACLEGQTEDSCYTGPAGTLGVGVCVAGPTRACVFNASQNSWDWAECQDTPPSIELCDGLDNDCDGTTDEGLNLGGACTVGEGACAVDGQFACVNNVSTCNAVPNAPQAETCNGTDDDCDGRVDETGAAACTVGVGECARDGVEVCDAVANVVVCNVQPGAAAAEICDGLDNDCDGNTDEGLNLGDACSVGEGVCARDGVISCDANQAATCNAVPGEPTDEVCDGLDNDCDGTAEEGLGLGNACDGVGECGAGVRECAPDHSVRCSSDPGGSAAGAVNEVCDGLDNDCDDAVDEVWSLGMQCYGICGNGVFECNEAGFARCSTDLGGSDHNPVAEVCDGVDNNCNYQIDEGFNVGVGCGQGQCAGGMIECDGMGGARCSTGPSGTNDLSGVETCNGVDEDCDGSTDEGFNVGSACDGVGECGAGVLECADGATTRCSTDVGGSASGAIAEVCSNGLDEDCDGSADEGCP